MFLEALFLLVELTFSIADIFRPRYKKQPLITMVGNKIICSMKVSDLT